jgi:indole-3-glycerol phosphate synthase
LTEAQAGRRWLPPKGPLGELIEASAVRAKASERDRARLREQAAAAPVRASFRDALSAGPVAVIAEVKRRSPSKGAINEGIVAPDRASAYVRGGARAISVLTEPSRFGGSLADLADVAATVDAPLLRKDFITAEVQLLEARAAGASAVLLIARGLAPAHLIELAAQAAVIGLGTLVEVRDEAELSVALGVADAVIGVNTRDLETLIVDPLVAARLIPSVPAGRIIVHESGVSSRDDVERAAALGADAILVGSAVSAVADGEAAVRALSGVARRPRG